MPSGVWDSNVRVEMSRLQRLVRGFRQEAWDDTEMADFDRAVVGLSGSDDVFERYSALIARIGSFIGEPIIRIDSLHSLDHIRKARGGIISGGVRVETSARNDIRETGYGRNGGHMRLHVPVNHGVTYFSGREGDQTIFRNYSVDDETVVVAALFNREAMNRTPDVDKDYVEKYKASTVYLGRKAIQQDASIFIGSRDMLSAIDSLI